MNDIRLKAIAQAVVTNNIKPHKVKELVILSAYNEDKLAAYIAYYRKCKQSTQCNYNN